MTYSLLTEWKDETEVDAFDAQLAAMSGTKTSPVSTGTRALMTLVGVRPPARKA